jgi:predicted PurR-regulated permease PerM
LIIAAILVFIWYFTNIFTYLVLSLVLASILRPLVERIHSTHFFNINPPRWLAIIVAYSVLVGVFSLFVILFIPLISEQSTVIAGLDYDEITNEILGPIQSIEEFLIEKNLTAEEKGFMVKTIRASITDAISGNYLQGLINGILGTASSILISILAVAFITFMLLYEKGLLRKNIIANIPNKYFEVSIAALNKIENLLSNYLLGLTFQVFAIFAIAATGLSILGVKYALTIALFAAFANLIPYAGPILGSVFGIIVGLSTGNDLITTSDYGFLVAKIVGVFSIVQLTDNIILQPLIFSKSVKVHPLEIFVIIFAGASLAGIPGMIAAIPVYTIIRVSVTELRKGYKQYYIFRA